jgi:hypothetical protein
MIYSKQKLAKDERGFVRYLGNHNGKQVKFRLGDDEQNALLAKAKLEALWQRVSKEADEWDDVTLTIAKAIAKGENHVWLAPISDNPDPIAYLNWIHALVDKFSDLVQILPEQIDLYRAGADKVDSVERRFWSLVARGQEDLRQLASKGEIPGSLHEALDDYIAHLKTKEHDHSGWGKTQVTEAEILRRHHEDIPLARLNLQAMEDMLMYWAKRPKVRNKDKPMSALSCRNYMKRLRDFWKWLHRSEKYAWRRPEDHDELKVRISSIPADREAKLKSVHIEVYSVEELTALYRHASPLMRTFILLGLNCGFSIAEIATLTKEELRLHQSHPKFGLPGSWILRVRGKSGVYGEFKLWDATVNALEWSLRRLTTIKPDSRTILLSADGNPYNARTKTGNKSSRIPNLWKNLQRTVQKEQPGFRYLPFKQLRKTAGQLVKEASDGEVAGVFLCHGKPVKSDILADVYTNRPFRKVFAALDQVEKHLVSMLAVADPFSCTPEERKL